MRIAYLDCFSGIAGDMLLGAMVAAGLDPSALRAEIRKLGVEGIDLAWRKVRRGPIAATKVDVVVPEREDEDAERSAKEIAAIIAASRLDDAVKGRASRIFARLAEAEAAVHGLEPDQVHFHEVGALDCIADICGAAAGLALLGIDEVQASPVAVGMGEVTCRHGTLPVPAPATVELLKDISVRGVDLAHELTTPTGAAIVAALARRVGALPAMRIAAVGYGAGDFDPEERPNVLRLVIGETDADAPPDRVYEVSANIDDATTEQMSYAMERLFAAGALDAFAAPITMKKSRPATLVTAVVEPSRLDAVEGALLRETTTFGVRRRLVDRTCLAREHVAVDTPWGKVRVKVGRLGAEVLQRSPEYEDCKAIAEAAGVPLRAVQEAALRALPPN